MARLSVSEIKSKIEAPTNGASLALAVSHERKVQVHTEPVDSPNDYQHGHVAFLKWVELIVGNKAKFNRFKQFLKFPYFTNEITDSIFNQLSGVFDSRNSYRKYDFENSKNEQDFIKYLSDISDSFFWKNNVWESIKNNINSVLVIDMPSGERTTPEPYAYVVKTQDIIDIENTVVRNATQNNNLSRSFKTEYIIYRDQKRVIALDDDFYRVFEEKEDTFELVAEVAHDLGYCPATQIYSDPFNSLDNVRKKGPLSTAISDLDYLLYFETFKRYGDSFIPNPITVKYAETCNYVADNGESCDDGKLMVPDVYNEGEYTYRACPKCASSSLVGPGEVLEVIPPRNKEEFDQIDAIKFVQPPLEGAKYATEEAKRRSWDIINKTVGISEEASNNQAQNEKQVMSRYETKQKIFRGIAVNIEIAQKFVHSTIAKLRYSDDFKGCSIFLGDEFFIETEKQLQERYKEEKENGTPEYELSLTRDKISDTKHKDNPNLLQKTKFLSLVEPFQGQAISEIQGLKKDFPTLISDAEFVIKINFDSFVTKYELEEMPLNVLLNDSNLSIEKKVESINAKLLEYAMIRIIAQTPTPEGGG